MEKLISKVMVGSGLVMLAIFAIAATVDPTIAHFPGLTLNGQTNIISDNGTALTRDGVAIGSGSGTVGTVVNTVAVSGLLAVDSTKTNGIAATLAHVNNAIATGPLYSATVTAGQFQQYQDTLAHAGTVTLDFASTNSHTLSITGNVTFATSNLATNRTVQVWIIGCSTNAIPTFPLNGGTNAWHFFGGAPPTITAGRWSVLNLVSRGTSDTSVGAFFREEE